MTEYGLQRAAVVGAGLTGSSWAGLFAAHGVEVRLTDRDPLVLESGLRRAQAAARFLGEQGLADRDGVERGLDLLRPAAGLEEALPGAQLVQEAVREDMGSKREVFRRVARLVPEALIATSSSGLSITEIQQAAEPPGLCLAAHPYNPPHLIPLVELAPGELTSPEALPRAAAYYRSVGKEPVVLKRDIPGYIGNRLAAALWREAIELARSGVATVEDIDRAVRLGPGFRWAVMGPHLLYDLGGGRAGIAGHLDHLGGIKVGILRDLATWTEFPDGTGPLLEEGLQAEKQAPPYGGAQGLEELESLRDRGLAQLLKALRIAGLLQSD
jgi:3-hydroxyacyl-CoA dehydrogenase